MSSHAENRDRLDRALHHALVEGAAFVRQGAQIVEAFERASRGCDASRLKHYLQRADHFRGLTQRWGIRLATLAADRAETATGIQGAPARDPTMIDDVVDPASPRVRDGAQFARALVTARGDNDLGAFIDLFGELRARLGDDGLQPDETEYLLGMVGSLALIAAIVARSAEQAGMTTDSGMSLLPDLFEHLQRNEAYL